MSLLEDLIGVVFLLLVAGFCMSAPRQVFDRPPPDTDPPDVRVRRDDE